jgi:hypothetical protein
VQASRSVLYSRAYAACVRDTRRLRLGAIGRLLLLNSRRKAPNELYPECSSSSLVVHGLVLAGAWGKGSDSDALTYGVLFCCIFAVACA